MGIVNFKLFLIAGILLNLTPGNDTIYILGKSMSQGKMAGLFSALGIGMGSIIHTLLATFGLSIIVAKSEFVFNLIKYIGSIYLIYLGVKMIFTKQGFEGVVVSHNYKRVKVFWSAVLTNVLNPKVAIFFLAFLPQFIDTNEGSHFLAFILLGLTFTLTGTLWGIVLAVFSSTIFDRFSGSSNLRNLMNRISGCAFIGLGIKLALTNKYKSI